MKKFLVLCLVGMALPVFAEEVAPNQEIDNNNSYAGINYNRQDTTKTGSQEIVNDHSWFNININIYKEGALFKKEENADR